VKTMTLYLALRSEPLQIEFVLPDYHKKYYNEVLDNQGFELADWIYDNLPAGTVESVMRRLNVRDQED
jgi:hypothetical protein